MRQVGHSEPLVHLLKDTVTVTDKALPVRLRLTGRQDVICIFEASLYVVSPITSWFHRSRC
jgi:hypothetical protein